MKLFIAEYTQRQYDYGTLLSTSKGVAWCTEDGQPFSVEMGKTIESVRATVADELLKHPGLTLELIVLDPITRKHDMNPHGFI